MVKLPRVTLLLKFILLIIIYLLQICVSNILARRRGGSEHLIIIWLLNALGHENDSKNYWFISLICCFLVLFVEFLINKFYKIRWINYYLIVYYELLIMKIFYNWKIMNCDNEWSIDYDLSQYTDFSIL